MATHNDLGKTGEKLALHHLADKGLRILETNWRYSHAEIDIIAMDGPILVFVEVKTRSTAVFGAPELSVTSRKQQLLTDAAHAYIDVIDHDWEVRFDVVSIVYRNNEDYQIDHLKDAFFLGLE